jgi:hypothetical protein
VSLPQKYHMVHWSQAQPQTSRPQINVPNSWQAIKGMASIRHPWICREPAEPAALNCGTIAPPKAPKWTWSVMKVQLFNFFSTVLDWEFKGWWWWQCNSKQQEEDHHPWIWFGWSTTVNKKQYRFSLVTKPAHHQQATLWRSERCDQHQSFSSQKTSQIC